MGPNPTKFNEFSASTSSYNHMPYTFPSIFGQMSTYAIISLLYHNKASLPAISPSNYGESSFITARQTIHYFSSFPSSKSLSSKTNFSSSFSFLSSGILFKHLIRKRETKQFPSFLVISECCWSLKGR